MTTATLQNTIIAWCNANNDRLAIIAVSSTTEDYMAQLKAVKAEFNELMKIYFAATCDSQSHDYMLAYQKLSNDGLRAIAHNLPFPAADLLIPEMA